MHRLGDSVWLRVMAVLALSAASLPAQEEEPAAKKPGVQIVFLPPPMEGTLALGIYNAAGKLVRVLAREAVEKDFTVGLNGFITTWDGRGDDGQPAPAAKYTVRGYAVGDLPVEGVAMHGNDFIGADDVPPRLHKIQTLAIDGADHLRVAGTTPDGKEWEWRCDEKGTLTAVRENVPPSDWRNLDAHGREIIVQRGAVHLGGEDAPPLELAGRQWAVSASAGPGDSLWVVDLAEEGKGFDVKQFSASGEFLRRLAADPGGPPAAQIASARRRDTLYILDESLPQKIQRLRALTLIEPAAATAPGAKEPAASTWKVLFEKTLWLSDKFADVAGRIGGATAGEKPFEPEEKITVRLLPNELLQGASKDLDVQIACDGAGSFLRTPDGLPLRRLTATPHLKWVVMGRKGGKVVTIFQSDGAVVEEFHARKLAAMMAFDAGTYEWAGEVKK